MTRAAPITSSRPPSIGGTRVALPVDLICAEATSFAQSGRPLAARLVDLIADRRNEGYTTTDELDAVLLRSGDAHRVRLDD
jgi:hypothetical protein